MFQLYALSPYALTCSLMRQRRPRGSEAGWAVGEAARQIPARQPFSQAAIEKLSKVYGHSFYSSYDYYY